MNSYRLTLAVHTETAAADGALVAFDFAAGLITPATAEEDAALLRLVDAGLAAVAEPDNGSTKKSAAKAADTTPADTTSPDAASDTTSTSKG